MIDAPSTNMGPRIKPEDDRERNDNKTLPVILELDPRIQDSAAQRIVKILPMKIIAFNQRDLPVTIPMFQVFLALNRLFGTVVTFNINQLFHAKLLREAIDESLPMFIHAAYHVIGNANIKRSPRLARQNVDIKWHKTRLAPLWVLGSSPRTTLGRMKQYQSAKPTAISTPVT